MSVIFIGKSGKEYNFEVYPSIFTWKDTKAAICIYAVGYPLPDGPAYYPLHIVESNNINDEIREPRTWKNHEDCSFACIKFEENESMRQMIVADLKENPGLLGRIQHS